VQGFVSGVTAVSTGGGHTCAITDAGGIKCWGRNDHGQLGDGTTSDSTTPVDVIGLASGVAAVSAGSAHTCALTAAGGLKCWGYNDNGRLGDGTTVDSPTPVGVIGLGSDATAVSAGGNHTCAITTAGGIKCWGRNYEGALGNGTTSPDPTPTPVDVVDLGGSATAIDTGSVHTCAAVNGAWLDCWGDNDYGQLGNGTVQLNTSATPVDLFGVTNAAQVAAGHDHNCARTAAGGVKCWGDNSLDQLGDGTDHYHSRVPVDVAGLGSGATDITAATSHTCALTVVGVQCWGYNHYGQLGDGTTISSPTPVDVVGLSAGVAALAAGGYHACALTIEGGVKCWGNNTYGQLGDGTTSDSSSPVDVVGLASGVASVSAGNSHSCAATTTGDVKCWGRNNYGQLGDGTSNDSAAPVDVAGFASGAAAVSAADAYSCAVTTTGGVKCWGRNNYGQLGDGTTNDSAAPVDVAGLAGDIAAASAGSWHACGLTAEGSVKCWGRNGSGQLGDGRVCNLESCPTPVDVCADERCQTNVGGISAVAAGRFHTCALTATGDVKCWGGDTRGQLGNAGRGIPTHVLLDSDGDGCPNAMELQTAEGSETSGGRRSHKNPWDYFNPTGDGENRVDDILDVVSQYFEDEFLPSPPNPPDTPNPDYDQRYDRTLVGPNPWNLGPPDGLQRVDDILHAVHSYFHDCGMGLGE
jgi:alpha-tubulin suppressor-like RCC1 family protein